MLGHLIFEYILHRIYFLLMPISLFTSRVSSLLSLLIDASGNIFDDEGSFLFSLEAEFTSPLYVRIIFATDTELELLCFAELLQF